MSKLGQLTNQQLNAALRRFSNYGAAIMKNEISNKSHSKVWICNLESTYQGNGDHWTMIYPLTKNTSLFFDPFGFPPSQCILDWARKGGRKCYYSTVDLQDYYASSCGWWCTMIIQQLETGRDFDEILRQGGFTNDTKLNEQLLRRYFGSRCTATGQS